MIYSNSKTIVNNWKHHLFKIYADLEAVTKKEENSEKGIKQIRVISGYSLCVKSSYEKDIIMSYRGEDAGYSFIGAIQSLGRELKKNIGDANAEMKYGEKEKGEFENAEKCHICECDIKKDNIGHLGNIHQWLKDMR